MTNCKSCSACPFAFTDESEYVQSLGCLPSLFDIVQMKKQSGHNWACHENDKKLCTGFANHIALHHPDLNVKTGNLISYDDWYYKGPEEAMRLADER